MVAIMLEELNQNINMMNMNQYEQHNISIHHSNFFRPKPLGVTAFDINGNKEYLAVVKEYRDEKSYKQKEPINIIEIHRVIKTNTPKLLQSIIEYEEITGIAWTYSSHLLTVTKQGTINLYDTKKGIKVFSTLTDYGPILSMKFSISENMLITGTEFGYVVIYTIQNKCKNPQVVFKSRLVKVNDKIESVDYNIKPKDLIERAVEDKKSNHSSVVKSGKRKRSECSSSSSESEEDDKKQNECFLDRYDLTIFGASKEKIIAWNFHRKTIIETIKLDADSKYNINTLTTLKSGKVIAGDSKGTVSIIDQNTFTCMHSLNVLQSGILTIAKSYDEKTLLISGKDPSIVILKRDTIDMDNYLYFEKIELHKQSVTCIISGTKGTFFTGSQDGMLARFSLKGGGKEKLKLDKEVIVHNYSNHVKFFGGQMMMQSPRSMTIWRLPTIKGSPIKTSMYYNTGLVQEEDLSKVGPIKELLIKTGDYIQATAFSKRWICYATKRGVRIYDRTDERKVAYKIDKKVLNCSHLQLCFDDRYLLAAEHDRVYLIYLDKESLSNTRFEPKGGIFTKFPVVSEKNLHSSIRQILFIKSSNTIVICCLAAKYHIYMFNYHSNHDEILSRAKRLSFKSADISFVTYNSTVKSDHNLYVYTNDDKIIKLNPIDYEESVKSTMTFSDANRIEDLPVDINILGMIILTNNICLLYDSRCIYKVDMQLNKVIKRTIEYNYIIKMNNSVFDNGNEMVLVELTPKDYDETVPKIEEKLKKKFGN